MEDKSAVLLFMFNEFYPVQVFLKIHKIHIYKTPTLELTVQVQI